MHGSSRRPPASTTSTRRPCSSSTSPATSRTPPTSCGARPRSDTRSWWSSGELPRDWPAALSPAARLEGAPPRRADAGAHLAVRGGHGGGHGPRVEGPHVRRPVRLARSGPAARAGRSGWSTASSTGWPSGRASCSSPTRRRASRSCWARPATPSASSAASRRRRRPGPSRSSSGASTAASRAARTAWPWSRTASCSARCASGGRRRCGASSRATSWSGSRPATSSSTSTTASRATSRCCGAARTGQERDYLELSFAAGDRIFVPVEQINRVSRYSGGEHRRSSRAWAGRTGCARSSGSARRSATSRRSCSGCTRSARRRTGSPTRRTRRGRRRWRRRSRTRRRRTSCGPPIEVKADMETRRPMDRLVVGDVGYGKTEVALRAAFKATQDGKQVAVLVPTTVLAGQHFTTFSQRFAAFPITVRLLSRFVGAREQETTVAGLASGGVDIVIGTHRLLSKDVAFRDLGLVVVDEEQRFGVAAKERLKQLRSAVDVLTLSATPIPRTLNLALAGIRDMSRHRDAARGPAADPDARRGGVRRPRPGRDPARARPRRPGVLRPQPGRDDRGPGRAAAAAAAGGADRRRPRADGRGHAREGDARRSRTARPTSSCAPRSSSPAWTSPTRTRSSSTGRTRSAWRSSTSSAGASAGPRGARTPTCSTAVASA